MNTDDIIPDDDATANAARHALHRLGGAQPIDLSWADVQGRARRVKQQRLSAIGAACAVLVIGAAVTVATIGSGDDHNVRVAGGSQPTAATSTPTTSTTLPNGSSSAARPTLSSPPSIPEGDNGAATVPSPLPTDPTNDTTTTQVVLQPNEGSWSSTASVDKSVVTVGDGFVVTVELTNTGTQLQTTSGYSSYGIGCIAYPYTDVREGLPAGQFFSTAPVMQPGETHTFAITFHAEPTWVGTLRCGAGYASHGDAYATYGEPAVVVEVVARPDPATTTTTKITP